MEPKKLKKSRITEGVLYSYRWWGGFFNIFGIIFSGFFTISIGYSSVMSRFNPPALIFSTIFLTVAIIVFYSQICFLVNKTEFLLNRKELRITTKPLPWPNCSRIIELQGVTDVYTKEYRGARRGMQIATDLRRENGETESIFSRWNNKRDPDYFAWEVKSYLKISEKAENEE